MASVQRRLTRHIARRGLVLEGEALRATTRVIEGAHRIARTGEGTYRIRLSKQQAHKVERWIEQIRGTDG